VGVGIRGRQDIRVGGREGDGGRGGGSEGTGVVEKRWTGEGRGGGSGWAGGG